MYNLCCISEELKDDDIRFQTMTWKRFVQLRREHDEEYALEQLGARWLNNMSTTVATVKHCARNGWGYRMSSSIFPLLTHPDFDYTIYDVPQADLIYDLFDTVLTNDAWQVRLSMHPDQFNVLASDNEASVERTIRELNYHGWIMDKMGCRRDYYNPINIHVNNSKGWPKQIADRFLANLERCDASVKTRLVVENEDKGLWNVGNLLRHFSLPVTFDNLHHKCNPSGATPSIARQFCAATWQDIKPIFHYSESHPNKANPRSHADDPTDLPPCQNVDWDIELKNKDKAIRKLYTIELTRESEKMGLYE